jgi:7-cyano-7-deazaguanine reductase
MVEDIQRDKDGNPICRRCGGTGEIKLYNPVRWVPCDLCGGTPAAEGDSPFKSLGQKVTVPTGELETFPAPGRVSDVKFMTKEVTSLCPVTGQPDWYEVLIKYRPREKCIESKSLKLYLWQFREEGHFCEQLAERVLNDCVEACDPIRMEVSMMMAPRGGIAILSKATYPYPKGGLG